MDFTGNGDRFQEESATENVSWNKICAGVKVTIVRALAS